MEKAKNYITINGYRRLRDELEKLTKEERPAITKVIAWAASNGDRSENADYIYGKRRLREIDRRMRFLQGRLNIAVVVDVDADVDVRARNNIDSEKIQFGATVRVEDESGEQRIYTVVGEDEVDLDKGFISWKSPLGNALLGKRMGEIASYKSPRGEKELRVVKIVYGGALDKK
ncbi:MAG: transcription elongation factor GreB [Oligoflexia bacterium]|nr:transcription elongation factor GreB [Oligoflexia bacterium]